MDNNIQRIIKKIVEYGIYLLVFLLPIQTRWIIKSGDINGGYWEYGAISLYATDILLLALLLLSILSFFVFNKPKYNNQEVITEDNPAGGSQISNFKSQISNLWWLIAGLDLVIFLSIFAAPDKLVAVFSYLKFLFGIGLFWLIIKADYKIFILIYSFLAGILLQAILSVWQFLSQSSFANKWLGMAVHDPGTLGASVIETLSGERWLRSYGGLDHPNMLGGLLVIGVLLTIGLMMARNMSKGGKLEIGKNWKIGNFIEFFTSYFLLLTFTAALFFTFSRGAWAALITGFLILLFINYIKNRRNKLKQLLKILLVMLLLTIVLYIQYSDLVLTRLSVDTRLEIKSYTERVSSYKTAADVIKENWLLGVGIGNYSKYLSQKIENRPSYYYQPVHNVFLLIFAEIGIIGIILFICSLFTVYCLLIRRLKTQKHDNYLFSLLTAIIVMFIVDHWWWSLHFGIFLFWFSVGLIYREINREN